MELAATLLVPVAVIQALQAVFLAPMEDTCQVVLVLSVILLVRHVVEELGHRVLLASPHWFSLVELAAILLVPLVVGQALQTASLAMLENTCLVVNVFPVIHLV